jgi:Tol biopolymer transport system component
MAPERRGQLDALLDVELLLPKPSSEAVTYIEGPAPVAPQSAGAFAIGVELGKYRLERLLGAGGMGVVWAARDRDLDRVVALKVLSPSLGGDGVARVRMVREARAMARLDHPNVIAVFDTETIDGHDTIAMELIDGETMASWLGRGQARDAVIATLLAAGRGLAIAHSAGMVHRDFKPHNVLVDRHGRVVVTDFGLVRTIGEVPEPDLPVHRVAGAIEMALTATGTVMGTPEYMPPEQLAGAPADARSDQFAFCATAWEALSGVRPFAGDSASTIAAAQASELPRAADRVPRRLRPILARGLAVAPAARWPSMDALLGALERTWRRPRRIAIACSVLSIAALAIVAVVVLARPTASPWRPRIADLPAYVENGDGIAISPDGTTYAYASDRDQADTYRIYLVPAAGGEPRAITPAGQSFQSPRWTRDGKALLMGHWDRANLKYSIVKRMLVDGSSSNLGPGFAADDCGDAIAIASYDGEEGKLELLRDGRRVILARTSRAYILVPRCDHAGQRIVFTRGVSPLLDHPADDIFTIDRNGHEVQLTDGNATANGTFTPDGRSVVFSALLPDGAISLFEVAATGGRASRLTYDAGPHIAPDVAPDGATLVFDRDESARVPISGGDGPTRTLSARRETLFVIAPTRDGTSVVADRIGPLGSEVVVIATSDGSERVLIAGSYPFLSLDGKRVWFRHHGGDPALASIALAGGVEAPPIALPGELITGVDAADGEHLSLRVGNRIESWRLGLDHQLVSEHTAGLVIPAPSGGWRAIRTFSDAYHYKFVAPDGMTSALDLRAESEHPTWLDAHRFAYAIDGAFHIIDVTTGAEVGKLPGPSWGEHAVLAADGLHWYDLMTIGRVTHHVIENFATRPWRY